MLAGATQILLSVPKILLRRVAEPILAHGDLRLTRVAPHALVDGRRGLPLQYILDAGQPLSRVTRILTELSFVS